MRQPTGIADLEWQKRHCGHRGDDGAAAGAKSRGGTAENADELAALHARPSRWPLSIIAAQMAIPKEAGDVGSGSKAKYTASKCFPALPPTTDVTQCSRHMRFAPNNGSHGFPDFLFCEPPIGTGALSSLSSLR